MRLVEIFNEHLDIEISVMSIGSPLKCLILLGLRDFRLRNLHTTVGNCIHCGRIICKGR